MQELRKILYTALLCSISFLLCNVYAQEGAFSIFDQPFVQVTPPGVSSQVAYNLLKDNHGFIWVSTRNGIDRYDGISYRHYKLGKSQKRTMHSGLSITIYCDEQGDIWAFTERSDIYRFDPIQDAFIEMLFLPDFQLWGSVQALYCQGDLLVIGVTDGIICYDIPTKTITKRLCPDEDIHTFTNFRNGELLFGATRGTGVLDLKDLRASLNQWVKYDVKTMYYDKLHNQLWVGCNGNGLFKLDPSRPKQVVQVGKTQGKIVTDIKPFSDREMLISVDGGGVYAFHTDNVGENTVIRLLAAPDEAPYLLRSAGVRSLLIDQRHIWIAGYMSGVTCLQPGSSLITLSTGSKLSTDNYAFGVDIAPDGRYWVAFTRAIGSFGPHGTNPKMYLEHEAGFLTVRAAKDGTVWCGGFNTGTYHFDPNTGKKEFFASVVDQPVNDCVYDIFEDRNGDIWLGGLNFQLTRMHALPDHTYEKTHYPITLVNSIAQLNEKTIITATTDGFVLIDIKTGEIKRYLNDGERWDGTNFICDIRSRKGHEVWVATGGAGLVCYDIEKDSISSFGLDDGLPSLELRGLTMHKDSILYVSTEENGLFAFDCANRCLIRSFMASDGLPMNEFLQNSSTSSRDGYLLFGGNDGAVLLRGSDIRANTRNFEIFIDAQGLNDGVIKRGRDESHTIDIKLATNDIYHQKDYRFFYRIKGFEDEWTIIGEDQSLKFSHLSPGIYDLEIKGVGAANQTQTRNIRIEIAASSFWAAHIIKISYILLFISLVCLFFSMRMYWKNRKQKKA